MPWTHKKSLIYTHVCSSLTAWFVRDTTRFEVAFYVFEVISISMVKLTMIARVLDGLPLAEGLDTDASLDLEYYKQQAKTLFKKLGQNNSYASSGGGGALPSRMSYESGEYFMHYVIESGVCYLTLCERNYPKKLAYSYLEGESKQSSFSFALFDSIKMSRFHSRRLFGV